MAEKRVGLYLGADSVGAVVTQGQTIVSMARCGFSSLEKVGDGSINEDIRWEALINKTLRETGSNAENIYISLADRDFIFRPLTMPIMSKREIESSLVYEVEKYIPFKIEELDWDYGYTRLPKEKKLNISFIGIRSSNLKRVCDILKRLGLSPAVIEPSSVSLARALKLSKKYHKLKEYALLDFTKAEAYLTFFQNDLPVFNRYLTVLKKGEEFDQESFIESVNFSFQYFKREFKTYDLEKFIIVSKDDTEKFTSLLHEGLQVDIETVSPYDLTGKDNAELESVKALGAAQTGLKHYKFKPNLRKTQERLHGGQMLQAVASAVVSGAPLRKGLIFGVTVVCLIPTIFHSLILDSRISEKDFMTKKMEKKLVIPLKLRSLSWEERREKVEDAEERINKLQEVNKELSKFSSFFEVLSTKGNLPAGLWLEEVSMDVHRVHEGSQRYETIMSGYVFLDNHDEEDVSVDNFVFILKKSKEVRANFSNVELQSSEREELESFKVTRFSIKLY